MWHWRSDHPFHFQLKKRGTQPPTCNFEKGVQIPFTNSVTSVLPPFLTLSPIGLRNPGNGFTEFQTKVTKYKKACFHKLKNIKTKKKHKKSSFFQILPLNEEISENIQKFTKKWKMDVFKNNLPMRDDFLQNHIFLTFLPSIL